MKIGIIVQARIDSTRFPKKILQKIYGNLTVLDFLLQRIRSTNCSEFILAVPYKEKKYFKNIANRNNFKIFLGPEKNVLKRFYKAATNFKLDIVVRITSDSPLISAKILNQSIREFQSKKVDYLSNIIRPSYPLGIHIEIFNYISLKKTYLNSKKIDEFEHVTPYIYNNPKIFKIYNKALKNKLNKFRLTIDYREDLKLLKKVIKITKKGTKSSYLKIVDIIRKNKNYFMINSKFKKRFNIKIDS